jgi:hypothetical protein
METVNDKRVWIYNKTLEMFDKNYNTTTITQTDVCEQDFLDKIINDNGWNKRDVIHIVNVTNVGSCAYKPKFKGNAKKVDMIFSEINKIATKLKKDDNKRWLQSILLNNLELDDENNVLNDELELVKEENIRLNEELKLLKLEYEKLKVTKDVLTVDVKDDVKVDVKEDVKGDVKGDVKVEIKDNLTVDVKDNVKDSIKDDIKEVIKDVITDVSTDVITDVIKDVVKDTLNMALNNISHEMHTPINKTICDIDIKRIEEL